jgi:hypothetical protein
VEQAKRVTLPNGTELDISPERPFSRFLKVTAQNVTVRYSLNEAGEIYELLRGYFENQPAHPAEAVHGIPPLDPRAAFSEDEMRQVMSKGREL